MTLQDVMDTLVCTGCGLKTFLCVLSYWDSGLKIFDVTKCRLIRIGAKCNHCGRGQPVDCSENLLLTCDDYKVSAEATPRIKRAVRTVILEDLKKAGRFDNDIIIPTESHDSIFTDNVDDSQQSEPDSDKDVRDLSDITKGFCR